MVAIDNEDPSLESSAVQLLRGKQKWAIPSSVMLNLFRRHPYVLTSLEKQRDFFDQDRTLLEPSTRNYEVFSTITPEKPSNFGQSLKVPDRFNWIKGDFSKYDENSDSGILSDTFTSDNSPSIIHSLWSVLYPYIKNISENIYRYYPQHCANSWPQIKGIDFSHYSSPFLSAPTNGWLLPFLTHTTSPLVSQM